MSSSSSTGASRVESGGVAAPLATIVVLPRERFSYAKPALASVLAHPPAPHRLVYVDAGAPPALRRYLEDAAQSHAFELVRVSRYLSPNRARNLGLARVCTPYVVFLDNDVVVTPGWLESLVTCAEETQATVVGPLVCEGEPLRCASIARVGGAAYGSLEVAGCVTSWRRLRIRGRPWRTCALAATGTGRSSPSSIACSCAPISCGGSAASTRRC